MKFNMKYFIAFLVILAIEVIIAVFVTNNFIRWHIGDVLVVVLIYCFIRCFIKKEIKLLWLYIFIFAVLVEVGQYFNLIDLLVLGEHRLARIIIGTTFDIWDIVCYFIGCAGILLFEIIMRKRTAQIKNQNEETA